MTFDFSVGSTTVVRPLFQEAGDGSIPVPTLQVSSGTRKVMQRSVDWMVKRHYLNRWPGTVVRVFRLDAERVPLGVCIYSLPPRETMVRYGVSVAWELSRLWIDDALPKNTESWFVAKTIQWIKKKRPDVQCLISYADPAFGHVGTIYKAGNWRLDGMTDDERKTPRFDYVVKGGPMDGKKLGRRSHAPVGCEIERVARVSKFRYVYRLEAERTR